MPLTFGIRLPPVEPLRDVAAAARQAEAAGFEHVWTLDSPLLAGRLLDPYLALGACAAATARVRLGVAVTNPFTRHPLATAAAILGLDDLSGGRAVLGIGSGDSAMRTLGLAAADDAGTHAGRRRQLRETVETLAAVFAGKPVTFGSRAFQLEAARRPIPIYIAATGAKMLELAGAIADGVILQVGLDERCVRWAVERIHAGARATGRDPARVDLVCSTFTSIGDDRRLAIDRARPLAAWFYGVAPELLQMAGLTVTRRVPLGPVFPDISHPADHDRAIEEARRYVPDEAVERFCLVGPVAECVERLRRLGHLGMRQIFLRHYLTYRVPTELIQLVGREIMPGLR